MRYALKSGFSLLLVVAALVAGPAMARDHGRGHDRDHDRGHDRYDYRDRGDRHDRHDRGRGRGHDRHDRHGDHYYRPVPRVVYRPVYHPGYGPPRWARGVRYYDHGYGPTYAVRDYHGYGLRVPPRGHYWRRSDAGDYLLVAAATGIIADLILHH